MSSLKINSEAPEMIVDLESMVAAESGSMAQRKMLFNLEGQGQDLLVSANSTLVLGEEGSLVQPSIIFTSSVDEYKEWVGRPDAQADNHPWEMPEKQWMDRRFHAKKELSAREVSDIEKAGWIYLFNDSQKVASYARAIEDYYGIFKASLYHFRRVVVQPGGRLILKGDPSVLLVDSMELQKGGQLYTYTISHFTIGKLKKTSATESFNN